MHLLIIEKPFDSVNRFALWRKLLCNNTDGKIFKVIFNIYDNAKSCVKAGENISMFLVACQVCGGVRICHQYYSPSS